MPPKDDWQRRARKSPRLQGYDYSQDGAYFVTIGTYLRQYVFGEIVDSEMILNEWGQIAESCWTTIPAHFPHVELDAYVVMPNHVHGIILIVDQPPNKSPAADVRTQHAASLAKNSPGGATQNNVKPSSLSAIIRSYKSAVTKRINELRDTPGEKVWHGRYHDHIIRNESSLNKIREYIVYNPACWQEDLFYGET